MDRESVERLRFDRRLSSRRDWVEQTDVDAHLEALPDVTDKMTTAAELEAEEAASAESAAPAPAAASSPAPTPEPAAPTTGFGAPTTLGGGGFGGDSNY